jgi:hypothetical protein
MKIYTRITNGQLGDTAELQFLAELAHHEGKDICVTVERKRKKRSLNQNAFMHGPFFESLHEMFREFGNDYDMDLVKAIFKKQFGVKKLVALPDGSQELVEVSTAEYTTTECEECMEKARRRYAEFWQLPFPNELMEASYG